MGGNWVLPRPTGAMIAVAAAAAAAAEAAAAAAAALTPAPGAVLLPDPTLGRLGGGGAVASPAAITAE